MRQTGFIGRLGTLLGNASVNIANFNLGRSAQGADAIALLQLDERYPMHSEGNPHLSQVNRRALWHSDPLPSARALSRGGHLPLKGEGL